jgi:nucleoside-diphosphate-sugar epimerase
MRQILVTGANGFVGRNLCRDLAARGYALRGTLRVGRPKLVAGIDYREVPSLEDNPDWRPHLDGCDGVVHCAALVHVPSRPGQAERQRHLTLNAKASEHLARQAREAGLSRMVFISSIAAGTAERATADKPPSAYGAGKLAAEGMLRRVQDETGLEVVGLRPPMIYGPDAPGNFRQLQKALAAGLPLPLGAIANARSFLYVGNLTDAVAACLEHPEAAGKVFPVSDGETLSTPDFVRLMAQAMRRPARLLPCPPDLLKLALALIGRKRLYQVLAGDLVVGNREIEDALGWTAPWRTAEGLAETFKAGPTP